MPIFQDHFIDNRNDWPTRDDDRMKLRFQGYQYLIQRWSDVGHSIIWKDVDIEPASEFRINAVIRRKYGGNHGFGLIWRGDDKDNCYAFEVSGSGYFKIKRRSEGEWTAVTEWTECQAIKREAGTNELTVTQRETEAIFSINNEEIYRAPIVIPAKTAGFGFIINGQLRLEVDSVLVTYFAEREEGANGEKGSKGKAGGTPATEEDLKKVC